MLRTIGCDSLRHSAKWLHLLPDGDPLSEDLLLMSVAQATQESATGHVSWLSGFEQSERPICMADAQRQAMHDVLAIHRELHALLSTRQGQFHGCMVGMQPSILPHAPSKHTP